MVSQGEQQQQQWGVRGAMVALWGGEGPQGAMVVVLVVLVVYCRCTASNHRQMSCSW